MASLSTQTRRLALKEDCGGIFSHCPVNNWIFWRVKHPQKIKKKMERLEWNEYSMWLFGHGMDKICVEIIVIVRAWDYIHLCEAWELWNDTHFIAYSIYLWLICVISWWQFIPFFGFVPLNTPPPWWLKCNHSSLLKGQTLFTKCFVVSIYIKTELLNNLKSLICMVIYQWTRNARFFSAFESFLSKHLP